MNWNLGIRQTLTIVKMELARYILARRWLGVYLLAFAPVALLLAIVLGVNPSKSPSTANQSMIFAFLFQTFILRMSIFFSCALVFTQLFRGEILEKTLHFYLLAPVRREVLALGKYLAGVVATGLIFTTTTVLENLLLYSIVPSGTSFFLEGPGISYLARYVVVVILACCCYGGIFTLTGLLFRNPLVPAFIVAMWEAFYFILPETLQKVTVMHYLQSLLPLVIDRGPFSVIIDPTGPILSVVILLVVAAVFVWVTGMVLSRAQVSYSAD